MPISSEDRDLINDLFTQTPNEAVTDNTNDIIETPVLIIDLDDVNEKARQQAVTITERLSNYYFDERYLKEHPYVPSKISQEIDNIRRLLKMLSVNESAQDALIANITSNAGKGSLYQSLTSLQNTMLSIQTQLNTLTTSLENIFKEMQAECEKTFTEKPKEQSNADGSMTVRGSRDFIKMVQEQMLSKQLGSKTTIENGVTVNIETGEIVDDELTEADILA
jgi:hypothetical protein